MTSKVILNRVIVRVGALILTFASLAGCNGPSEIKGDTQFTDSDYEYLIGPGDSVEIFVWGNQELTTSGVTVKPDGKITTRLVENIEASGKTASQLARDIEAAYSQYVKHAVVTVIVHSFSGVPWQQVRVVGEATSPKTIPFKKYMTLLDLMIDVGGLNDYADGNNAILIRTFEVPYKTYKLRLEDLLKDADITANVNLYPGDIVLIPEAWF